MEASEQKLLNLAWNQYSFLRLESKRLQKEANKLSKKAEELISEAMNLCKESSLIQYHPDEMHPVYWTTCFS